MMKRIVSTISLLLFATVNVLAQCAMCKTTIKNNVSAGELSLAEGLNFGILYLFFTPYILVAVIGFFWYRSSRKNARAKQVRRSFSL